MELLRSELLHDIEFESWKIAKICVETATLQERMQVDFEADDWIERKIEEATDEIYGRLSFCLDERNVALRDTLNVTPKYNENNFPEEPTSEEEMFEKPRKYTFHFTFEEGWNGSVRYLRKNLHRYVVCYTLAEWFTLVKPDEVAAYAAKAAAALRAIEAGSRPASLNCTFRL